MLFGRNSEEALGDPHALLRQHPEQPLVARQVRQAHGGDGANIGTRRPLQAGTAYLADPGVRPGGGDAAELGIEAEAAFAAPLVRRPARARHAARLPPPRGSCTVGKSRLRAPVIQWTCAMNVRTYSLAVIDKAIKRSVMAVAPAPTPYGRWVVVHTGSLGALVFGYRYSSLSRARRHASIRRARGLWAEVRRYRAKDWLLKPGIHEAGVLAMA